MDDLNLAIAPILKNFYLTCGTPYDMNLGDYVYFETAFRKVIAKTNSSRCYLVAFEGWDKVAQMYDKSLFPILMKRGER